MHRRPLIHLLENHLPFDANEAAMLASTLAFVRNNPDCFERSLLSGHVTASALVLSHHRSDILLMHHRKLGRWLQPGGHCDGDPDVKQVSLKEVREETGVEVLSPEGSGLFDVDVHAIPANGQVPAHFHYDIRFLFVAAPESKIVSNEESNGVRWIPLAEVPGFNNEESILRMVRKLG